MVDARQRDPWIGYGMAKRKPIEETISESDADELTRTVARNVRRIRKEKGITIDELSEIVGVSLNTIYGWEHARHSMKTDTLSKVASALGIDPLDLVLPEGSRVIEPGARPTLPIYRIEPVDSDKAAAAWEKQHPLYRLEKTGGVDVPGYLAARHMKAFGYLVEDGSCGLVFPMGQIVVIDPEIQDLKEHGMVLALWPDGTTGLVRLVYCSKAKIVLRHEVAGPEGIAKEFRIGSSETPYIIGAAIWDCPSEERHY